MIILLNFPYNRFIGVGFIYKITFPHTNRPIALEAALTSEENIYGFGRWYDGHVSVTQHKFDYQFVGSTLRIVEVTEYRHVKHLCSAEDSYYQCLAKRFLTLDYSELANAPLECPRNLEERRKRETLTTNVKLNCPFKGSICSPFLLPIDIEIPLCTNNTERECYSCIVKKLKMDQDEYCKKSCYVKEFKTEKSDHYYREKRQVKIFTGQNGYDLDYRFVLPTKGTVVLRTDEPFKIVKKEYLIMHLMLLVGNVGGTLGSFVGFSFITTSEWFLEISLKSWIKVKQIWNKNKYHNRVFTS